MATTISQRRQTHARTCNAGSGGLHGLCLPMWGIVGDHDPDPPATDALINKCKSEKIDGSLAGKALVT